MCICVVLSWDELKVRQNLLASDYEIYMVCLLVAIVNWHKSLQFVKKSNIAVLPCLFIILLAVSMITLIKLYHILARFQIRKMKLILFCRVRDIFKTPKDIHDFTNCPTHRSNLGVGWSRVPKEVSGHSKGRVKPIPKVDRGTGKRVSQIVLKMCGKFIQSGK